MGPGWVNRQLTWELKVGLCWSGGGFGAYLSQGFAGHSLDNYRITI